MVNLNLRGGSSLLDAELIAGSGSNYIRYSSGIQICWGGINSVTKNNLNGGTITFPVSFANTSYEVILVELKNNDSGNDPANNGHSVRTKNTSNIAISSYCWTNACRYIAIGKWK